VIDRTPPALRVCQARAYGPCVLPGGHSGDHTRAGKWWRDEKEHEMEKKPDRDERHPEPGTPVAFVKKAVKSDGYKVRMELLTTLFLQWIARVLTFGAIKYEDHNWSKGFDWSRLIGAAERHLLAFKSGEDWDPETGEHHLAHLGCEIMFLVEHVARGLGNDDRLKLPPELPVPPEILKLRAQALETAREIKKQREALFARAAHNADPETRHGRVGAPPPPPYESYEVAPARKCLEPGHTCITPTACKQFNSGCSLVPSFDLSDVEADGDKTVHPKVPTPPEKHGAHWCEASYGHGPRCERPPGHEGKHRAVGVWW